MTKFYYCKFLCFFAFLFMWNASFVSANVLVWHDQRSGYAIGGYDPVAYFTRGEALIGDENYQMNIKGSSWKFSNIGNKEAFSRHPKVYLPKFAGYDSYALGQGIIARGLPTIWIIRKKRLFFFHNVVNLRLWLDDPEGNLMKARENLPKLQRVLFMTVPMR